MPSMFISLLHFVINTYKTNSHGYENLIYMLIEFRAKQVVILALMCSCIFLVVSNGTHKKNIKVKVKIIYNGFC